MRLLAGMLQLPPWRYFPLRVHVLSEEHAKTFRGEAQRGTADRLGLGLTLCARGEAVCRCVAPAWPSRLLKMSTPCIAHHLAPLLLSGICPNPAPFPVLVAPMEQLPLKPGGADAADASGGEEEEEEEEEVPGAASMASGSGPDVESDEGTPRGSARTRARRLSAGSGADSGPGSAGGGGSELGGCDDDVHGVGQDLAAWMEEQGGKQQRQLDAGTEAAGSKIRAGRRGKGKGGAEGDGGGGGEGQPRGSRCELCQRAVERHVLGCSSCSCEFHIECLGQHFAACEHSGQDAAWLRGGACPSCGQQLNWMDLLTSMKAYGSAAAQAPSGAMSRRCAASLA